MKHFKTFIRHLHAWFSDQRTYYWIFLAVLLVPNLFLCCTEPLSIWGKAALILVPAGLWMALLSISRRPGIPLWILFPMLVMGAFQLVLLYLFGNSIIAVDMFLNVATTNSGEALELLGKLMPAIVGVIVLYVPALILAVMSIRLSDRLTGAFRRRNWMVAISVFVVGLGTMGMARWQNPEYRAHLDLWPVNIGYNMKMAVNKWEKTSSYAETSKDFTFSAIPEHPDSIREVYVMVVGETSRALNWQLYGYGRETNPHLSQTPRLVHFTDMLTQANATHKSVPIMLSGASAENYDVLYTQKSVLTAFKEAGFRTAFFSNQLPNGSFIDYFGEEADTTIFLKAGAVTKGEEFNPYDSKLLTSVDMMLEDTAYRKLFIVLHTYGSHFDFQERYSVNDIHFKPASYESVNPENRDILINAYDNSIRATDELLHDLIERLSSRPGTAAALLYASDHGEDIFDDKRNLFLHASPIPTYYQLHIPFVMWFSETYDSLWPDARRRAVANSVKPVTTNIIFHTLLAAGGVGTPYRNDSLAVTSDRFTVTPRHYLNDHNKPRTLDRIGLKSLDIAMFDREHLDFPVSKRKAGKSK